MPDTIPAETSAKRKEQARAAEARRRERLRADPDARARRKEQLRAAGARHYVANKEARVAKAAARYAADPAGWSERVSRNRRENPEPSRRAAARYRLNHRAKEQERQQVSKSTAYAKNPSRVLAYNAERRSRCKPAAWADHTLIADIYEYASIMRAAGIDCHVDHIEPLRGKHVSGLHTHDNLTVLTAEDNLRKGDR